MRLTDDIVLVGGLGDVPLAFAVMRLREGDADHPREPREPVLREVGRRDADVDRHPEDPVPARDEAEQRVRAALVVGSRVAQEEGHVADRGEFVDLDDVRQRARHFDLDAARRAVKDIAR